MNTQTTKVLTEQDLAAGGGVDPEDGPEAARMVNVSALREIGLPFRCVGGKVVQDQSLTLAEELHEVDRESRLVYFEHAGEYCSVQYSRPVDIAISAEFEPWPDEESVLVTLYDMNEFGKLCMREVGDETPDAVH